jgi:hypothetical protein
VGNLAADLVIAAASALARTRSRPVVLGLPSAPAAPGLYAIHASPAVWVELGLGEPPDERPLYVGKSESSLAGRDVRDHFGFTGETRTTSITGYSTVRRSLASLLHDSDGFRGVPRNQAKPGHYANYGLTRDQDAELSAWMRKRLQLACWSKPEACSIEQLEAVERRILRDLRPPLNLRDVVTHWTSQIDAARKVMATEARAWPSKRL